ncbi:MAG: superoxide dismutase [Candidatus Sericytochromatia bacterium]|nr:superoxide dismutase [Candidatus Sericytochromatia bacterium]
MKFTLPELPYAKDAFAPYISAEGFDYHYGKHHATYVTKLNELVQGTDYENKTLEEVVVQSAKENKTPIFNNSAQHWNHSFFWNCLSPSGGSLPTGKVAEMIDRDFGSFDAFKEKFSTTATTLFGSGWAWLVVDQSGKLEIVGLSNAGTPLTQDKTPILTLDVWEHAYYIDHRNARPKHVEGFWNVVNWDFVNSNIKN